MERIDGKAFRLLASNAYESERRKPWGSQATGKVLRIEKRVMLVSSFAGKTPTCVARLEMHDGSAAWSIGCHPGRQFIASDKEKQLP